MSRQVATSAAGAHQRTSWSPDVAWCALVDVDVDVDVEQWDPRAGTNPTSTSAKFDLSDSRTVVGPGEDCLVCDEPLVVGEVFVLGSWDGRAGPAHENCPRALDELLADDKKGVALSPHLPGEGPAQAWVWGTHDG